MILSFHCKVFTTLNFFLYFQFLVSSTKILVFPKYKRVIDKVVMVTHSSAYSDPVITVRVLGLIHTCDFLGVNYCVNFSVHAIAKNWYITHY